MSAFAARLIVMGLCGVLSLAFVPVERLGEPGLSAGALRALILVQPLALTLVAIAVGLWAAPRAGLDAPAVRAWAHGGPIAPILRAQLPAAAIGGALVALVLILYQAAVAPVFAVAETKVADLEPPLVTKLLYGGVAEELQLRWGLMSLLALLALRVAGTGNGPMWAANVLTAMAFAAGHLPLLFLLVGEPGLPLLAAVLGGNFVAGLVFGHLYWRHGLEAAMMAHALAHLLAAGGRHVVLPGG